MKKKCSKCGVVKPLDMFHERKDSKDEHRNDCKACRVEYNKTRNDVNPNKAKAYHYANRDRILKKMREYRIANHEYFLKMWNDYDNKNFFYKRHYQKHRRLKLISNGLCTQGCGNPIDFDRSTCKCTECLDKSIFYNNRYMTEGVLWK